MGEVYLVRMILEFFCFYFFLGFLGLQTFEVIRQEPKMIAIAIFTLVICCIGVEGHHGGESLPGDAKRETTGCSVLFFPKSSGTNSSGTNSSGQTAVDKQQWTNSSGTNSSGQTPMHPHFPPPFPPPPPLKRYEVFHISDDPEQTRD